MTTKLWKYFETQTYTNRPNHLITPVKPQPLVGGTI